MQKENFPETYAPGERAGGAEGEQRAAPRRRVRRPLGCVVHRASRARHGDRRRGPQAHVPTAPTASVYGLQIWLKTYVSRYFESTLLQELEWHLHTVLFALVLGFGTIYNTHVRVDLVRDHVNFRKKIWIEFLGLSCFMIPYLLLVIYFASSWVVSSYQRGRDLGLHRGPEPPLDHQERAGGRADRRRRIAGVAVWLQVALLMWGSQIKRFPLMTLDWPEEAGTKIEGKERIVLDETPGDPGAAPRRGSRSHEARRVDGPARSAGAPISARAASSETACSSTGTGLFKRYVGDDIKTPYFFAVGRLTRVAGQIRAVCLHAVPDRAVRRRRRRVAVARRCRTATRSPCRSMPSSSRAPPSCSASRSIPAAAAVCASAPVGVLIYFTLFGFHPNAATGDKILQVIIAMLWLRYSWRILQIARAYPTCRSRERLGQPSDTPDAGQPRRPDQIRAHGRGGCLAARRSIPRRWALRAFRWHLLAFVALNTALEPRQRLDGQALVGVLAADRHRHCCSVSTTSSTRP